MNKYYHLISLGCPKNLIDSEVFSFLSEKAGYQPIEDASKADMIIVNTCGFIQDAKSEAIETILDAVNLKELGNCSNLIVTGCLVKRYFENLKAEIPEIDVLVDLKDFKKFSEILGLEDVKLGRKGMTLPHYAYLRTSDGCNNNCTYCAIPGIRGKLTSLPFEEVIEEAKVLAARGVKEVIITAQDTTQYGLDLYGERRLPQLLKALDKIEGFKWIRLLYLHPAHLTHELIDVIAETDKILHYFDIPLQHISDDILRKMNRKKYSDHIKETFDYLLSKMPDAMIRTTFIVGFPGEQREDFELLKKFITKQRFARLGVFTYSPEEDTKAVDFKPLVTPKTALNRHNKIMEIQQDISSDIMQSFIGKEIDCIVDKVAEDEEFDFEARSWFDAPDVDGIVFLKDDNNIAQVGDIVTVRIFEGWEYDLIGEVISRKY